MHTRAERGYGLGLLSSIWDFISKIIHPSTDDHPIDFGHMSDDQHLVDVFGRMPRQKSPEYSVTE